MKNQNCVTLSVVEACHLMHLTGFDGVYPAASFDSAQDDGGAHPDAGAFRIPFSATC